MSSIPIERVTDAAPIDDCWNRIGVIGDQSCPKLVQHVHCRNCEVYSGAAQRNLQRAVGTGYLQEWAGHFREPENLVAARDQSVLVFRIGREWLALPTRMCQSVAPTARPHRLPHRNAPGLLGVVNVGGKLQPAVALATLIGIDEHDEQAQAGRHSFARLLLLQVDDQDFALPVADLHGILRYGAFDLQAPAATINKGLSRYLEGVLTRDGMHVGVLDAALVGHQLARLLR